MPCEYKELQLGFRQTGFILVYTMLMICFVCLLRYSQLYKLLYIYWFSYKVIPHRNNT